MSRVTVSKAILLWAMDRSGRSVEDLETKFPKIKQWVSGDIRPTMKQLEAFAKATRTPFGFLFLTKPPSDRLPIPFFRTQQDKEAREPSPDLLESIRMMEGRQSWVREYLIDQGNDPRPFVASIKRGMAPKTAARQMRIALDLADQWAIEHKTWTDALRFLRQAMEAAGILVVANGIVGNNTRRKLDPGEFRGFVLVDDYAPLVFVNNADAKAAQMFTLAHELAHIFIGKSAAFDLRRMKAADHPLEKACDRMAAEFLVPEDTLLPIWNESRNDPAPYEAVARKFKVSAIVAARRLLDTDLITHDQFSIFYRQYRGAENRGRVGRSEGGDFYKNQNLRVGKRFAALVHQAAREGKLLYSEAYQLTGLYGKTFDSYISSL